MCYAAIKIPFDFKTIFNTVWPSEPNVIFGLKLYLYQNFHNKRIFVTKLLMLDQRVIRLIVTDFVNAVNVNVFVNVSHESFWCAVSQESQISKLY